MFREIYKKYNGKEKILGIKKEVFIGWTIFLVVFVIIHLIAEPTFVDDKKFRLISEKNNYDVLSIAIKRYSTWTSRFLIDLTNFVFISLPSFIWKVIDIVVLAFCYKVLAKLSNHYIGMALLICAYPFQHMASAGWVASTINYVWPFTAALVAFYILYKKKNEKNIIYACIYILLMIFASFSEIMCVLNIITLLACIYFSKKYDDCSFNIRWIILSIIISVGGLINTIICVGNKQRIPYEIKTHMPEYNILSWFDKIRICTVSTLQHFTSLPNILFLTFSLLLLILGWENSKKIYEKVINVIPLLLSIALSAYYFVVNVLINRNFHYVFTDIILKKGTKNYYFNYVLFILALIYFVSVIWNILIVYGNSKKRIIMILILLGGLISRFILIASPTMLASGPRMYFVLYMSIIWICANMIKKIKQKSIKTVIVLLLAVGIVANIGMVYITQIHQG